MSCYLAYNHYASKSSQKAALPAKEHKFTQEDQQNLTIKEAEQLIKNTDYNNALSFIQQRGDLDSPSTFNEDTLYTIAVEVTTHNKSLYYASTMQKVIYSLQTVKEKLKQYVPVTILDQHNALDDSQETQSAEGIDTITPLIEAVDAKMNTLNKLYTFFRMHAAYINLVQTEKAFSDIYRSIIKIVDQEEIDATCSKQITNLLAAEYPHNSHPYIDAHQSLRKDIKNLYETIEATDKTRYPHQTQSAQVLLEKLELAESIIISSDEIANDRAHREKLKLVKEKQDLENSWKDKEFRLVEKQQRLEQEWQHKAEMMYEKGQRETQKIAREKQELEKELKEREFRLIEKQQRLEREWQKKSELYAQQLTKEYHKAELYMEQIAKEYRLTKAALEDLRARVYAVEKAQQPKAAQ